MFEEWWHQTFREGSEEVEPFPYKHDFYQAYRAGWNGAIEEVKRVMQANIRVENAYEDVCKLKQED